MWEHHQIGGLFQGRGGILGKREVGVESLPAVHFGLLGLGDVQIRAGPPRPAPGPVSFPVADFTLALLLSTWTAFRCFP